MIGRLKGQVLEKQPPMLLIDVGGVGYEVLAPMSTFYALPESGTVILHTHFSVSENAQQLFGFADLQERVLFRHLIKVSGVGPKMALAVLSGMEPDTVVAAIREDNISALTRVPGVGKKTAERLVIEMRDRVKDWQLPAVMAGDGAQAIPAGAQLQSTVIAEAESAMVALGYKPTEASKAIASIIKVHDVTRSEELIRLALRSMLPG
ncbi:Holliday junction branch migration protein RuvA [Marinagarivorans algicola]|uniref:Holliday junction branch migration protein RuvA n=1 Tax=Marinagarivorans algicola TaxID=1513270 RepID=UPI0006B67706|nr:Holliday junction branch migration protein RuvA [Marinagarivorans algicola]